MEELLRRHHPVALEHEAVLQDEAHRAQGVEGFPATAKSPQRRTVRLRAIGSASQFMQPLGLSEGVKNLIRGIRGGGAGHGFHEAAEPQPKVKSHSTALFGVRQLALDLTRILLIRHVPRRLWGGDRPAVPGALPPRRGGRKLARGERFLRTPGDAPSQETRPSGAGGPLGSHRPCRGGL